MIPDEMRCTVCKGARIVDGALCPECRGLTVVCPIKAGDTVVLCAPMHGEEELDPIPVGTKAEVEEVDFPTRPGEDPHEDSLANFQLWVQWENGRRLSVLWPIDKVEVA